MTNRFTRAAEAAAEKTNVELRDELARLTRLSEADIRRLVPTKEDKERLAQLLAVVGSARTENQKVAALRSSIETLGPVVVRVLKLLMV